MVYFCGNYYVLRIFDIVNIFCFAPSDFTSQKIFLNYLQVVTLCSQFRLRWPAALRSMFAFQGAISTLGEHLVNPDCVTTSATAAELYYSKVAGFAFIPVLTLCVSFAFWYAVGKIKNESFFQKRLTPTSTTYKDKFVVSVTSVMYLLYPTLVGNAFGVFDCKQVGAHTYLRIDLNEECFVGQHMNMVLLLGVSQLILCKEFDCSG